MKIPKKISTFPPAIAGIALLVSSACSSAESSLNSATVTTQKSASSPVTGPQQTQKSAWEEIEIGRSSNDQPLNATIYGTGKKAILVLGGIHGNEPASAVLAKALDRSLRQQSILPELKVIVIPEANPDGLLANTRQNARNVDLNRNFPSASWQAAATKDRYQPGKAPGSEPETKAILSLLDTYRPVLIVSIHAPLVCVNWDGPAEEVAKVIAEATGYPLKKEIGYPTPGSLGTFAGIDRKIPTITLELRAQENREQIEKNVNALMRAFQSIASK